VLRELMLLLLLLSLLLLLLLLQTNLFSWLLLTLRWSRNGLKLLLACRRSGFLLCCLMLILR
jgi:hypothetical protein